MVASSASPDHIVVDGATFRALPDKAFLDECFEYDPDSGHLTWRSRPQAHFSCSRIWKSFNAKFAGKKAMQGRSSCGYSVGRIAGHTYHAHRVIWKMMTGRDPRGEIDHIDGVRDNNVWSNLRVVRHSENMKNTRLRADNKTGECGVTERGGRYCARVQCDGRRKHIGYFDSMSDAVNAVRAARIELGLHENHGSI